MKTQDVTELILEVFRLNGALIASGDALVADLGLTSARWQVLGAIALQDKPAPVVRLAENMGLTRQSVQRVTDDLADAGLVNFAENPNHRRAKLVKLTRQGEALYSAASRRQGPWAQRLRAGISTKEIEAATQTLARLRERLVADQGDER
jgi:DNA-binding MarR family transcriptional regulator